MQNIAHVVYGKTFNTSVNKDGSVTIWTTGAPKSDTVRVSANGVEVRQGSK